MISQAQPIVALFFWVLLWLFNFAGFLLIVWLVGLVVGVPFRMFVQAIRRLITRT